MPLPKDVTSIAVPISFRELLGVAARVRGMSMRRYVELYLYEVVREDMRRAVAEVAAAGSNPLAAR